jgi:type I restriction enzyme S subunit
MAAVEKARAAAEAQLQAAKALPAAYLREVFPAPDAPLPEGWKWAKLDDIAERVPTGKQYERLTCKESGKVPVIDQSISGYMGFHDDEAGVLASESNPIVTFANHTCAVRLHRSPFSVIQNVFPLKAKNEVSPTFLYWLLKDRVPQVFYGGHYPKLVAMDLPLPSCSKQREIAEFLSRISLDAERLVVLTQMELGEITALPAALLRQAFSGQL